MWQIFYWIVVLSSKRLKQKYLSISEPRQCPTTESAVSPHWPLWPRTSQSSGSRFTQPWWRKCDRETPPVREKNGRKWWRMGGRQERKKRRKKMMKKVWKKSEETRTGMKDLQESKDERWGKKWKKKKKETSKEKKRRNQTRGSELPIKWTTGDEEDEALLTLLSFIQPTANKSSAPSSDAASQWQHGSEDVALPLHHPLSPPPGSSWVLWYLPFRTSLKQFSITLLWCQRGEGGVEGDQVTRCVCACVESGDHRQTCWSADLVANPVRELVCVLCVCPSVCVSACVSCVCVYISVCVIVTTWVQITVEFCSFLISLGTEQKQTEVWFW